MDRKSSSLSQVLPNEISMKQEIKVLKWNQSFTEDFDWLTEWIFDLNSNQSDLMISVV